MIRLSRILCVCFLAALLAGLWGCAASPEDQSYRQGKSALSSGKLAEATGYFGALGDYQDSRDQLKVIYDQALALYQAGSYREASPAFQALAEYNVNDARNYAAACRALVCLEDRDGSGVRAALAEGDAQSLPLRHAAAQADTLLFPGTALFRPEFVARELVSGELTAEIRQMPEESGNIIYLYAMDRQAADRIYQQYREFAKSTFADTFQDESDKYFSFRADGVLCYVSNFYSVDGGMVIRISAP